MKVLPIVFYHCRTLLVTTLYLLPLSTVLAQEMDHSQHQVPPANEPVVTSHAGHAGAWMFEYQYMRMFMKDLLDGTTLITNESSILNNSLYTKDAGYGSGFDPMTFVGTDMFMDMHMLMLMYNQTSNITWEVMLNYVYNDMNMIDQMSAGGAIMKYPMRTQGLGDTQIFMTYKFATTDLFDLSISAGISLPTGTIDASDGVIDMTTGVEGIAPYSMQPGSGTYDIYTKFTLSQDKGFLNYGAQVYRITRTGLNPQYYNRGDYLKFWGWARYKLPVGTQLRAAVKQHFNSPIEGRDVRMSDNTKYTGSKRLEGSLGIGQSFGDFSIYADYAYPFLQRVNGVQMRTTGTLSAGVEYMFM